MSNARVFALTIAALGLLLGLTLDPAEVLAQTRTATEAMFADGFVPVPGGKPKTEEVNASWLVVIAYGAFALAFVGYLFQLARTQNRIAKDIQDLGRRIDSAGDRD